MFRNRERGRLQPWGKEGQRLLVTVHPSYLLRLPDEARPAEYKRFVQDLVGATEIAQLLGVTRQRVHQLSRGAGFPEPVARLSMGTVWNAADIQDWIRDHRHDHDGT